MNANNPPRKHHFAPAFYLERWAGADGQIEQYSRPRGAVKRRRLFPTATGYQADLYSMPGLPAHLAQQVEERFMQQVDHQAAAVLPMMEAGRMPTTHVERSAWTRFLQSLQLRTPADVAGVKARTRIDWGVAIPKVLETYESLRRTGDPMTFEEFVTSEDPQLVERMAMKLATVLIDNPQMGGFINNMHWTVLDLSASSLALLASDRGTEQPLGLGDPRALITLPIGPEKLFVAANQRESIRGLQSARPRDLVMLRNKTTVCLARQYVWARDQRQDAFVRRYFGTVHAPTLGEQLANMAIHDQQIFPP